MTIALVALNIAAFFLEQANPQLLIDLFALWPPSPASVAGAPPFQPWQLVTYSALHANGMHLAFNMFGIYMFGRDVERVVGRVRLGMLYVASVLTGGIVQITISLAATRTGYPTIGASAGVFGLLVSYALLFPQRRVVLLFPPIPMPAWVFATGYAVLELLLGVSGKAAGIAHFAHLGGMLGAIVLILYWSRTRRRRGGD
jgi:membrane associated rhomboid family serine protease